MRQGGVGQPAATPGRGSATGVFSANRRHHKRNAPLAWIRKPSQEDRLSLFLWLAGWRVRRVVEPGAQDLHDDVKQDQVHVLGLLHIVDWRYQWGLGQTG